MSSERISIEVVADWAALSGPVRMARSTEIISEVTAAVRQWRVVASRHGLSRAAQDRMRGAFRLVESRG